MQYSKLYWANYKYKKSRDKTISKTSKDNCKFKEFIKQNCNPRIQILKLKKKIVELNWTNQKGQDQGPIFKTLEANHKYKKFYGITKIC